MSAHESRRVLVLAAGQLGERLAGPEIRALEFARALSRDHTVTLAVQRSERGERDGIPVVPSNRRTLLREAVRHDAILSSCLPPYLLALRPAHRLVAIADLYDPHEQELATLADSRKRERELAARVAIETLHLRHSDMVLCASERQRVELLHTARRRLPSEHQPADPIVLPFGIPDPPPPSQRRPLREHFPQISAQDKIVLWWGSVWRWLDAETAIRAFAKLSETRADLKLVITAGRPPSKNAEQMFDAAEEMRALAEELGVLGSSVLFLDRWIPYEERYDYLREADIGLTLHRHAEEARLAARARYMDYLSGELPCVLGRGDETAEELEAGGFATLLDQPDPDTLARTLIALVDDPQALEAARAAGRALAAERHWSAVGDKLRAAVAEATSRPPRSSPASASLALFGGTGAYYARRALDVALSAS